MPTSPTNSACCFFRTIRTTLRGLLISLSLCLLPSVVFGQTVVTGHVKFPDTTAPSNAKVCINLQNFKPNSPRVIGTGTIVSTTNYCVTPAVDGSFSFSVYGNNVISPSSTTWRVDFHFNGIQQSSATYLINHSPFNLDTEIPLSTSTPAGPNQLVTQAFPFTQLAAASVWTITHNLGNSSPLVEVYDASGNLLDPTASANPFSIKATSANVITITFTNPQAGTATVMSAGAISLTTSQPNAVLQNPVAGQTIGGPSLTITAPTTHSGPLNTSTLDGIQMLMGLTDLALGNCLTSAGANGTCWVTSPITITSAHTIGTNNTTLRCEPGMVLTSGVGSTNLITLAGIGDRVLDCQFSAGSFPASVPITISGTNALVEGNTSTGFTTFGAALVYLSGSTKATIKKNWCTAGSGAVACIFGEKNSLDTTVSENVIDESAGGAFAQAIAFHGTTAAQSVSGTKIIGNTIVGGQNFCVEVGAFGGSSANDIIVANNKCKLGVNSTGGYSIGDTSQRVTVADNTFNSNGFTFSIGAIEFVNVTDGSIVGNVLDCSGASNAGCIGGSQNGSHITVSGNIVNGFGSAVTSAGIGFGTSTVSANMSDITATGNTVIFPTGGQGKGIFFNCNAASTTCNNNTAVGNEIKSDGTANSVGVSCVANSGTLTNCLIGPNNIIGPSIGIQNNGTNTTILPGINTAATPIQDTGSGTIKPTGSGGTVLATSPTLTTPTLTGLTNGTGLQFFNVTPGAGTCPTAASVGAFCTTAAITLPVAYADTNYRVVCVGLNPTNVPTIVNPAKSSATQFTITIAALTAAAANYASYDCIVGHN